MIAVEGITINAKFMYGSFCGGMMWVTPFAVAPELWVKQENWFQQIVEKLLSSDTFE